MNNARRFAGLTVGSIRSEPLPAFFVLQKLEVRGRLKAFVVLLARLCVVLICRRSF